MIYEPSHHFQPATFSRPFSRLNSLTRLHSVREKLPTISILRKMSQHPADAQNFNILNNDKRAFY